MNQCELCGGTGEKFAFHGLAEPCECVLKEAKAIEDGREEGTSGEEI